jgi:hypothetical protein
VGTVQVKKLRVKDFNCCCSSSFVFFLLLLLRGGGVGVCVFEEHCNTEDFFMLEKYIREKSC